MQEETESVEEIPEHAQLVLPASGDWKRLGLFDQPQAIQKLARKAIETVTISFFLQCAWQTSSLNESRLEWGKPILLKAAEALEGTYPQVKDAALCIEANERYAESLSYLVSSFTSPLRWRPELTRSGH